MIPYLNQKIWYAFQGLLIEMNDSSYRLPWSKSIVLTNNLMYILQLQNLTEAFRIYSNKEEAEGTIGVTFEEYAIFLDAYLKEQNIFVNKMEQTDRGSQQISKIQLTVPCQEGRPRVNTLESHSTYSKPIISKGYSKSESDISASIYNFNDYCWTLYKTKHLPQINIQSSFQKAFLNLWLLFIMYAIKSQKTGEVEIPVKMDLLEAKYWSSRLRELLGTRKQLDEVEIEESVTGIEYNEFHLMIQNIFKSTSVSDNAIINALQQLTEEALEGVVIKGQLKIDRYNRFCVLKSGVLMIYNSKVNETHFRSSFVITKDTELLAGNNKIQLKSTNQTFVTSLRIEIFDVQLFNKWHTAFADAIESSEDEILNPALKEARKREETWNAKRAHLRSNRFDMELRLEEEKKERSKLAEAMELQLLLANQELNNFRQQMEEELHAKEALIKQNEDIRLKTENQIKIIVNDQQQQYNLQLEKLKEVELEKNYLNEKLHETMEEKSNEEMKRTLIEEKHMEAQQLLLEAEQKINSLEKLSEQLEKAFEEEKQAKENQERVRNATFALLEEELRSKEKLEMLLQQQNSMMDQEIQKRNEFAQELENEKARIIKIAEEKEKLSKELEETQQKMRSTGNRVRNLDTSVSRIAETIFGKEEVRFPVSHRGLGFISEVMAQLKTKSLDTVKPKDNENDK